MADAFKAAFNGSTGNRLNCACIWFPSLPFFFSPPPLFQRLIDPLSLNASISFPFHSLSTFSFFTLLYFTRLAFAKFKKISTFLSYQISISSRLFFPRRRIFSLFFIPDLCTDFPRSKSRVETQRGRDRSRKRNIIPGELFQIENGTRLSREKATATLARRIKLRCSFRENFTLLHFAGASGGGRESPIRWRPPREGDNFPWSHVTRRGRKDRRVSRASVSLAAGLFRSARSLNFSQLIWNDSFRHEWNFYILIFYFRKFVGCSSLYCCFEWYFNNNAIMNIFHFSYFSSSYTLHFHFPSLYS